MLKVIKKTVTFILWVVLILILTLFLINFYVIKTGKDKIYKLDEVPHTSYALVFGASVYGNSVSATLAKRLDTAVEVYNLKKVDNIIVSGDHGASDYNEVSAMKEYLLKKGIPENKIYMDHSGFETYDSVSRAKTVFNADSITLISQEVHIIRALYIADRIGITSYGVSCDNYSDSELEYQKSREFFARIKAFLQCDLKVENI